MKEFQWINFNIYKNINKPLENREPLCVHSVGNEAGEHSWWYLSYLLALATFFFYTDK